MDTSQTEVQFEEPGNYLKSQVTVLLTPRNTGFTNELLKRWYLHFSRMFQFLFQGVVSL